jgi:hypothetical protein
LYSVLIAILELLANEEQLRAVKEWGKQLKSVYMEEKGWGE